MESWVFKNDYVWLVKKYWKYLYMFLIIKYFYLYFVEISHGLYLFTVLNNTIFVLIYKKQITNLSKPVKMVKLVILLMIS